MLYCILEFPGLYVLNFLTKDNNNHDDDDDVIMWFVN